MKSKVEICYPSFSKKAVTFSIDDGDIINDRKFIDILKPAGIIGTFNLNSEKLSAYSPDFYRNFYRGFEIANHCKYHPFVFYDGIEYKFSHEPFSEETADDAYVYNVDAKPGFYWVKKPNGWRQAVSEEDFIRYVTDGKRELEEIFGEGSVKDFVWPYGQQDNKAVERCIADNHRSSRKTGCSLSLTEFDIPADKYAWTYNANHMNLLDVMAEYDGYPDDGRLKFFCFGVHSIDYERALKWDELSEFATKYGNRTHDFWYAAVGQIFDYEAAAKQLVINDNGVYNPSSLPIYIKIGEKREVVSPLGVISF